MNIFARMWESIVNAPDSGFMLRDGKPLLWPVRARVEVFVAEDIETHWLDLVYTACDVYNMAIGRPFFARPEPAIPEMLRAFADPNVRPHIENVVVVRVGERDPFHGDTDLRYDKRTGRIINAVVTLPRSGHSMQEALRVATHEFGHACGLDHDRSPKSIMHPRTHGDGMALSPADAARLRRQYG